MYFTLFGTLWFLILIISGIRSQKTLAKVVILSALFQAGAVIIVGDNAVVPLTFSCVIYLLFFVLRNLKSLQIRIPKYFMFFGLVWLWAFLESILSSLLFKGMIYMPTTNDLSYVAYNGDISLYGLTEWMLYGVTSIFLYNDFSLDSEESKKMMDIGFWIVLIIGVWQYATRLGIFPQSPFIKDLIYSNSVSDSIAYLRSAGYTASNFSGVRFYSSFMEASYAGGYLNVLLYYYLTRCLTNGKPALSDYVKTILSLSMILLTLSTTAYVLAIVVIFFIIVQIKNRKPLLRILGCGLLLIFAGVIIVTRMDLWESLLSATVDKGSSASATIRNTWNSSCVKTMLDTYSFGLGFGNIRGSSLFFTLLGSIGIIGSIGYIIFSVSVMKISDTKSDLQSSKRDANIHVLKTMFIIINIAQLFSIGIYNYSIYWMILFILTLSCSNKESAHNNPSEGLIRRERINYT